MGYFSSPKILFQKSKKERDYLDRDVWEFLTNPRKFQELQQTFEKLEDSESSLWGQRGELRCDRLLMWQRCDTLKKKTGLKAIIMFDKLLKMMEIFTRSHFPSFWLVVGFMWRRILLHTCFQPNITDWTCTAWFPLGENHIWGRTVFPFSFLNKFQKPTENRFLTETWQKSLQLWERNLKCVLRKSCSPRLATLLTRDWGIIQRWRVWWSKSFERKKGVQAWNSVKYFHPCYAEVLLHNMENQCFCRTTLNISRRNPNLLKD